VDKGKPDLVSASCKSPRDHVNVIENSPKSLSMRDGTDCVAERPASSSSPGYTRWLIEFLFDACELRFERA
jgi:hypothetical protein